MKPIAAAAAVTRVLTRVSGTREAEGVQEGEGVVEEEALGRGIEIWAKAKIAGCEKSHRSLTWLAEGRVPAVKLIGPAWPIGA